MYKTYKREIDAKCTILTEDDDSIDDRVTACSSLNTCYDTTTNTYLNDNCSDYESCGLFKKNDKDWLEGCILNKYCNLDAKYKGFMTKYECRSGKKDETPLVQFNERQYYRVKRVLDNNKRI